MAKLSYVVLNNNNATQFYGDKEKKKKPQWHKSQGF